MRYTKLVKVVRTSSMFTILTNVLNLGLGLVTSIMLARWLEPAGRGELAAAILWPMMLVSLGGLGIGDAVLYYASRLPRELPSILGTGVVLVFFLSIGLMALGYSILPLLLGSQSSHVIDTSRFFLLVIPISMLTFCFLAAIQAAPDIIRFNLIKLVMPSGYFLGVIALVLTNSLSVQRVVILLFVLNLLVLGLAVWGCIRTCGLLRLAYSPIKRRDLVGYGSRVYIGTIAANSNSRLDQVVLASTVAPAQLGLYMAALGSTNLLQVMPLSIGIVAFPSIAKIEERELQVLALKQRMTMYWLGVLGMALPLAVSIPWLLPQVYGSEFRGAVMAAEVLLIAAIMTGVKSILNVGARAVGQPLLGSQAEAVGMIVSIPLLLILVPRWGIIGAAITAVITGLLACVTIVALLSKRLEIPCWQLVRLDFAVARTLMMRLRGVSKQ